MTVSRLTHATPWFDHGDRFDFGSGSTHASPEQQSFNFSHLTSFGAGPESAPTMAQEVAYISGVTGTGKVAATSFAAWNQGTDPATYQNPTNAAKWGSATPGSSGGTIKYFFDAASSWTATEKAVFNDCLALWSSLTNIKFSLASSAGAAKLLIERGHSGAFDQSSFTTTSPNAGKAGGTVMWTVSNSTVSIDTTEQSFGPITKNFTTDGGYPWTTILHELGHAIGLGHPGPYDEGQSENPDNVQFSPYDSRLWSVMSYIDPSDSSAHFFSSYPVKGTNWGTEQQGMEIWNNNPTTPMMLDILAAQAIYGVPTTTAFDGGQVFGFNSNLASNLPFYDFTVNKNPVVTIWDAGTNNTLDLSGYSTASKINLTPGTFSSCNGQTNNIGIAFNTKIDKAIGGSAGDTIVGNADANTLIGGGGNDKLTGGAGADSLNGGAGKDTFIYTKASDSTGSKFDTITGFNAASDKLDIFSSVTKIDKAVKSGSVSKASVDHDLATILAGSKLAAHSAVVVTPSAGDLHGHVLLVIDPTGSAGYSAGHDLVIQLTSANMTGFGTADFI